MTAAADRSPGEGRGLREENPGDHRGAAGQGMKPSRTGDAPAVRIEAENEWAWCGEQRLQLMPKAFAVLRHLVDHAGRLITKEELLTRVWRDAIVSDAALTTCIRDLRRALGDSSDAPRYIETVHRRGFRFIGPIAGPTPPRFARAASGVDRTPGCDPDAGRAGRRARAASRAAGEGDGPPAAARLRDGRAGDREDDAGRSVPRRDRPHRRPCASVADSAWSSTAPAKPICRCSRRSGAWVASRAATRSFTSSSSMRRPGSRSCRRCSPTRSSRRCSAGRRARRASGCCAS